MEQRYAIVEQRGQNLFKAQRKADEKAVMLKKVSFSSVSPKKKEHIVNEVNTLLRMDYIHIIRYLDYEINKRDVTVDIVMEYCQGGSLHDLLAKARNDGKKLNEDEIWRIFYQLAQALDYIHRDSIMHRNINPTNVYFRETHRKNVKLGGFSLSKKLEMEQDFSATVLPNTHYLSPEQLLSGTCNLQTDIWALGCLIYQACALTAPFRSTNEFERAKLIKEGKPKKLPYSLELNRVVFWCLEKQPEDRPSIGDLLGTPEINLRIRERRYQEKYAELLGKEEKLNKKEKELQEREGEILREIKPKSYESLKKRGSEIESSRTLNFHDPTLSKLLY